MTYLGEIAALGVSVTWAASFIFFLSASRRIGSFSMSHYRMLFVVGFVAIGQFAVTGSLLPHSMESRDLLLLSLSGLAGFFVCDALLLQGNVEVGPRMGSLVFSFYPFVGAVLAWVLLGERMSVYAWMGMTVTLSGIALVVLKKEKVSHHYRKGRYRKGVVMLCGAAIFQALSFIAAKPALISKGGIDPLTATLVRAIFGGAGFWLISVIRWQIPAVIEKRSNIRAMILTAGGAFFGATGVWLSMIAVKYVPVGIATTLMSLIPVVIIPMTFFAHKEKITARTMIGAVAACVGVAILFLAP